MVFWRIPVKSTLDANKYHPSNKYQCKNILYGGPDVKPIVPGAKSLGETIVTRLLTLKDKLVLIDAENNSEWTAVELLNCANQCVQYLKGFDLSKEDIIAISCENRFEFVVITFATFLLGATLLPINITYTDGELLHVLNLTKPKIIFVSHVTHDKIGKITKSNERRLKIISFDGDLFPNFNKDEPQKYYKCEPADIKNDIALILCSSGTTGLPKGVQNAQSNILVAISHQFNDYSYAYQVLQGAPCYLAVLPWFHAYGILSIIGQIMCGTKCVFLHKFEKIKFLKAIETYEINLASLVPPILVMIAKDPIVKNFNIKSLQVVVCGAAPVSNEIIKSVTEQTNIKQIFNGYGMTELTLAAIVQDVQNKKPSSTGILTPGFWGKVIDPETGKILGPNKPGEICFTGSSVMYGYINNEAATKATIDKDGWLHTGDVGYYDEDGEWFIVDRIKELIKYKGFQVPPAELERLLLTHEEIRDAAVIGIPDEYAGELPMAFVVLAEQSNLTETDIIKFVAANTSVAKQLHGGVKFINEIPKNPSGKILRRKLRELITPNKFPLKL